ncbi:unnamed protein product [Closterium sp. NIES-64]|nr:unnamed protein product [Closterium sp. NIES-64]
MKCWFASSVCAWRQRDGAVRKLIAAQELLAALITAGFGGALVLLFAVVVALQASAILAQTCSCADCETVAPPCYASRWYAWWIKDDCSSQALWNSVQASSDVRSSVLAVWGPGTAGASTSFQDYVLMAANNRRNPSCVKTYLLDWIKCKAAPTDSAVQFYNSALGVGVSGVKDVRSLNTFVTAVIKKIGQTVFNTLAGMLRQRGLQAQVVMAGTWC